MTISVPNSRAANNIGPAQVTAGSDFDGKVIATELLEESTLESRRREKMEAEQMRSFHSRSAVAPLEQET